MGGSDDGTEERLKNMNEKLNEKTMRLLQEANEIMESDSFSVDSPIWGEPGPVKKFQSEIIESKTVMQAACFEPDSKPEDNLEEAISKLGKTTQTRVYMAKLRALESENKVLRSELRTTQDKNEKLSSIIQEINLEKSRLDKQTAQCSNSVEKLRTELESAKQYANNLSVEKISLERQLEKERRRHEKENSDSRNLEVRFQRALEDVYNLRLELEKSRSDVDIMKKEYESVSNENRRLERQKTELISAFKKQMKLIDVLRRQKMLIEASRALKMTEEEFMKTLDWHIGFRGRKGALVRSSNTTSAPRGSGSTGRRGSDLQCRQKSSLITTWYRVHSKGEIREDLPAPQPGCLSVSETDAR